MAEVFSEGEEGRIHALERLELLDSEPEECFDRITRIVADTLQASIALISLVDRKRQWFKSRVGIEQTETPRDQAFCARTISSDRPFVVEDAANDPEFACSELVCGEPGVRFYAGVPLYAGPGIRVGALCVMDRKARLAPTPDELRLLQNLAGLVEEFLKMRLAAQRLSETESALRNTERSYRSLVENCPTGIYRMNLNGEFLLANPAVLRMFGFESFAKLSAANANRKSLAA